MRGLRVRRLAEGAAERPVVEGSYRQVGTGRGAVSSEAVFQHAADGGGENHSRPGVTSKFSLFVASHVGSETPPP